MPSLRATAAVDLVALREGGAHLVPRPRSLAPDAGTGWTVVALAVVHPKQQGGKSPPKRLLGPRGASHPLPHTSKGFGPTLV